jgi:phosphoribosyl-dephospho-CoA transferase
MIKKIYHNLIKKNIIKNKKIQINNILSSKEKRYSQQKEILKKYKKSLLTITGRERCLIISSFTNC